MVHATSPSDQPRSGQLGSEETLQIIAAICEDMQRNGYCHSPRVVARNGFDLSRFKEQTSDIPGVGMEYVNQSGPGMAGDDYSGTMAYPIGDHLFVIEY